MANLFTLPRMEETLLCNGLRVILIPDHEQEGMAIAIQFPFGRFADPEGFEGCAELCVNLMQKGTCTKGFEELSDSFEHNGASLFADVGEEHTMMGVRLLSRCKDTLFPLLWEVVTQPRFDEKELGRIQQEMSTALRAEMFDPGTIAAHHFFHELAGNNHPAGRYHTIGSIKRITREKVIEFYGSNVLPAECTLVVAGDFKTGWFETECRPIVEKWQPSCGAGRHSCEAPPVVHPDAAIRFVEKNDLTQVSLMLGEAAVGELHEDRNRIALANYIFGAGNFSSRLMTRVRSSAGKTYGIVSHLLTQRRFGALTISTSTQNRGLEEVLSAVLHEFELFCDKGVTGAELENAKRFAIGNMAFQLEGITNLVEKVLWLTFYNRPAGYIETFDRMINGITLEAVNGAVRKCFDPAGMIIVAVGKKSEVLKQLGGFGAVRQYHYKERLVS